ncbi:RDD family protein [Mameliella alba]|nr:RDD family protein [Mameliella sediminis]MBY6114330.1 RDD family protein [Antarctobacter heliothermus]MBY6143903.1 RDD family protein [Mameliella alba]MBY6163339.1 RDD family protein [Mameliella alba]MBY6171602.1 RDD family protein [Mameliella alba]
MSHLPDPDRQAAFYDGVTIKRGVAWVLDTLLISLITLPIAIFSIVGLFMIPLLFLVIGFLYRWMTIAGRSATPGMRFMNIEFRNAWGERFDGGQAFLHTLGYTLIATTVILQLASIVLMFLSERGQGLHDMVLGTVALNRRA